MSESDSIFLIVIVVVLAAGAGTWMLRRGRRSADGPGDRGPYSSHTEAAAGAALFGATMSDGPHDSSHGDGGGGFDGGGGDGGGGGD